MSRPLAFEFDADKFVNAASYLAAHCPGVTKLKLFKLLYFADKQHLLTYGRPIIGDRYVKMDHGPVPSRAYNILKHDDRAKPEEQQLFDSCLRVQGNDVIATSPPNLDYLSETDIEVLDEVVSNYGRLTASQLRELSHREAAWQNASLNCDMDYRFIFANAPDAVDIERLVQEDQQVKDALANVQFEESFGLLRS